MLCLGTHLGESWSGDLKTHTSLLHSLFLVSPAG
ncbi:hypothetical protein LEMLEM_LOCUS18986 [Lemmus lemmus]